MKYYKVSLEPIEEEFEGVVEANSEEEALEKVAKGEYTRNWVTGYPQREFVVKKVSKNRYIKLKKYSESR